MLLLIFVAVFALHLMPAFALPTWMIRQASAGSKNA